VSTVKHPCASGNEELVGANRGREYCAVPNSLIRNGEVPAEVLAFVAWRGTFVGNYASSELITVRRDAKKEAARRARTKIKPPFKISREGYYETLQQSQKLGLIERKQADVRARSGDDDEDAPRRSKFGRAIERLFLPEIGADGFTLVYRDEFDGTLTAKEMGAYLCVLAGTGKGPHCCQTAPKC
jgi:hypothetical protein